MTIEQEEVTRKELIKILAHDRVGEVQGVRFDLRHPALDPAIYFAPDIYFQFHYLGIRYHWEENAPTPEDKLLNIGDRVFFHKVDRFHRGDGPLADPHDANDLWADVGIERSSGKIEILDEPIVYVALDAMGPYSDYESIERDPDYRAFLQHHDITFKKIAARISRLIKAEKFTGEKGEWLRLADDMLTQALDEVDDVDESVRDDAFTLAIKELGATNENLKSNVEVLIDLVATASYALARAEGAVRLAPLAKIGLKAQRTLAAATGAARKANMKADTPALLSEASAMCAVDPNLSLSTCAKRLVERFGRDQRNVRQTIKHLFEPRTLSSGQREYRPKRKKGETGGTTG